MQLKHIEDHAGIFADDVCGAAQNRSVDKISGQAAQKRDGAGFGDDGAEDGPAPSAERAEDREFAAAFVHGVVDARKNRSGGDEHDKVRDEFEDFVDPAYFVEEIGHDCGDGPGERRVFTAVVDQVFEVHAIGGGVVEFEHDGADFLVFVGDFLAGLGFRFANFWRKDVVLFGIRRRFLKTQRMSFHAVNAFDWNPDGAVVGCVGRLEHADDCVDFLMLVFGIEVQAVKRLESAVEAQAEFLRDVASDDGFALFLVEDSPRRRNYKFFA